MAKLVKMNEACDVVHVRRQTLYRIARECGGIIRISDKHYLYDIEVILDYMRTTMKLAPVDPGMDKEADQDTTGECVDPGLDYKGDQETDQEEDPEADQDSTESVPKAIS